MNAFPFKVRAILALVLICGLLPSLPLVSARDNSKRLPFDKDRANAGKKTGAGSQILYHGGPVMLGTVNVYAVYYGSFALDATSIIDTFLENVGGSAAFDVNTTYYDAQGNHIRGTLSYSPSRNSYTDNYSQGRKVVNGFPVSELQSVLQSGHLPTDANGIYILMISPDVNVPSDFYCGYHTHSTSIVSGTDIKYAVIPEPSGPNYQSCSGNLITFKDTTSPNNDIGADSVTDTAMHEISETVTDPDLNAWFTHNGLEVGDLCNFIYGQTFLAPNGSHADHVFGKNDYLVQTIWENSGNGFCALSYPSH
jgi:hypothetical protein